MMRVYSEQSMILFHCTSAVVRLISVYGPLTSASHGFAFARIQIANYLCKGNYTASFSSTCTFTLVFSSLHFYLQRDPNFWSFNQSFWRSEILQKELIVQSFKMHTSLLFPFFVLKMDSNSDGKCGPPQGLW